MNELRVMYGWVKDTRKGLLDYCSELTPAAFVQEDAAIGHGSIRNLLLHMADCYTYWLAGFALGEDRQGLLAADYPDVAAIQRVFAQADGYMDRFLNRFEIALDEPVSGRVRWAPEPIVVTPRWLFMHSVTHEFHHKGQVVSLGRRLGYPPPETDLVLPGLS